MLRVRSQKSAPGAENKHRLLFVGPIRLLGNSVACDVGPGHQGLSARTFRRFGYFYSTHHGKRPPQEGPFPRMAGC